jgi:5-methylcytosine-specific restriction endonuclease McrA
MIRQQLDVDHIDGNHRNNNPENLQTLCANCHRLKTFRPDLFDEETALLTL